MNARTCAVIVAQGDSEDTLGCIASLAATNAPVRIVVVDNGSQGTTLRGAPPESDIEILHPTENLGFSRRCNMGIECAMLHTSCEFIWLLHSDILVCPDTLLSLEDAMDEHPRAGLATGRVVFEEEPTKLYYGRGNIDWRRGGCRVPGFGRDALDKRALRRGVLRSGPVGFAPQCSMLIKREVIKKIGGLDETFFMYEEGVDLSLRVSKSGRHIFYCPEAEILHRGHAVRRNGTLLFHDLWSAALPGFELRIYHLVRNSIVNVRKHARGRRRVEFATLYPWFVLWKIIRALPKLGFRTLRPAWRGVRDGLKVAIATSRNQRTRFDV